MLAPLAETSEPGPFLDLALDSLRRYPGFVAALRDVGKSALCRALPWQPVLGLPCTG